MMIENKEGVGIEMEGFILDYFKYPKPLINERPSSEWIMDNAGKKFPKLKKLLSAEEASVMIEIKSEVQPHINLAVEQILDIREKLNILLRPFGFRVAFVPVAEYPFEFFAATSDPSSRTQELIREWSKTPKGKAMLYQTAIAGFQINDSRPFAGTNGAKRRMEKARLIHNSMSENFPEMHRMNPKIRDYNGQTRMEKLFDLMRSVKGEQFKKKGYAGEWEILIPPFFENVEEMKRWMTAHSGVETFDEAKSKNEHAATVKIKRGERAGDAWIVESRAYDSVDTEKEIIARAEQFGKMLEPFIHKN